MTWSQFRQVLFSWASLLNLVVMLAVAVACQRRGFGEVFSALFALAIVTLKGFAWEVFKFWRAHR